MGERPDYESDSPTYRAISEALSLQVKDVDCSEGILTIQGTKNSLLGARPFRPARMASRMFPDYAESLIRKSAQLAIVKSAFGIFRDSA